MENILELSPFLSKGVSIFGELTITGIAPANEIQQGTKNLIPKEVDLLASQLKSSKTSQNFRTSKDSLTIKTSL